MKVGMKKEARIDPNAIIKEKRCLNIVSEDYTLLKLLVEHCGSKDASATDTTNTICTSKPSLTKVEKRKAKKKKQRQTVDQSKVDNFVPIEIKPEDIIPCTTLLPEVDTKDATFMSPVRELVFKEAPPVDNFA